MCGTRARTPRRFSPTRRTNHHRSLSRHRLNAPLRFVVVHHAQLRGLTGGEEIPRVLSVVAVNGKLRAEYPNSRPDAPARLRLRRPDNIPILGVGVGSA